MSGLEGLLAGRVLADRYRIDEVIGRGGMGAVYRALDERLGREVAVKVITFSGGADPEARERIRARFRHEAASAARLPHHPNVVPVYDYGTDPALGLDFLVMELLRGQDLAALLARSGPPTLGTALEILREAAQGVAVGHRAGLIHRDVKPGNIFLVREEQADGARVRILDFGIAKAAEEGETSTQLTQDGRAPLSPAYASPEQLRGEARLTPASDVFSLGAVGFQMLTGERPFTDADRNRMGIGLPVPVPSLRARNPALPPEAEEVIRRALAPDPAERFPQASAMAAALGRLRQELGDDELLAAVPAPHAAADDRTQLADAGTLLAEPPAAAGAPTEAAPAPLIAASRRRRREAEASRSPFWLVLLLVLAGGGAFGWWMYQSQSSRPVGAPLAVSPDSVASDTLVSEPAPDPMDAFIANREGIRLLGEGRTEDALAQFQRAASIVPDNAEYRENLGYALLQAGSYPQAAEELEEAVRRDPARIKAYGNLAEARLALGDTVGAEAAFRRVLELSADARLRAAAEQELELITRPVAPDTTPTLPRADTVPPADTSSAAG